MDISNRLTELDKIANSNIAIDKTMPLMDYGYCMKMRELYNDYKSGSITLDSCKRRKQEFIKEYTKLLEDIISSSKVYLKYQENIKKSEILRAEINKSSDLQEMLLKSLEIVSLLTGDETFYKINSKKVGDDNG